jgi:hypothetical protein
MSIATSTLDPTITVSMRHGSRFTHLRTFHNLELPIHDLILSRLSCAGAFTYRSSTSLLSKSGSCGPKLQYQGLRKGLYRSKDRKINYYRQSKWKQHNTQTNSHEDLETAPIYPKAKTNCGSEANSYCH